MLAPPRRCAPLAPFAFVHRTVESLLDLLAPPLCAACSEPWPAHPPRVPGQPDALLCASCAALLDAPEDPPPPSVIATLAHHGPLARAIHRAKYGTDPHVARRLGLLLAHHARDVLPMFDTVVPVPLHRARLASRGFNQAMEIARALGAPVQVSAVIRTRDTPSQVGLSRAERYANVRDAFAPGGGSSVRGLRVLVVDDVVTTGATLAGVIAAVLAAGARSAHAAAVARAPLER